ncbi:MAG: endonuclease domain-containing protein, partial [Chloroflexi bacterium]|nr:endonuclease domain-containing protein [Chloroflexota bacterium]
MPSPAGGRLGWGSSLRDRARELRGNPTEAEKIVWRHLRLKQLGGNRFRRQHPIGKYIVDFFCFEKGLVIEVDGGHHSEQEEYDQVRTMWLESCGYRVLRFWTNQILNEIDKFLTVILKELEAI